MTREQIEQWAEQAEQLAEEELQCVGEYHPDFHAVRDQKFAAFVAAAEREACAREAEFYIKHSTVAKSIAKDIRARGKQ